MIGTLAQTSWPTTPAVPESTKALLSRFFEVGDSGSEDVSRRLGEEVFTEDGQIVVNKKVISGAKEISASNHGMMTGFQSREHKVDKVYTCSEKADDLILIGTVRWTLKNGRALDGPFAARAVVDQSGNASRLSLYQGWADMTELLTALGPS